MTFVPDNIVPAAIIQEDAAASLRHHWHRLQKNEGDWPGLVMALAKSLAAARKSFGGNDRAFGHWLTTNGIALNKDDRAAYLKLAEAPDALEVLQQTDRRSIRHIVREELTYRHMEIDETFEESVARTKELIKRLDDRLDELGDQLDRVDADLAQAEATLGNWQPQNEDEEFEKRQLMFEHEQMHIEQQRHSHYYEYQRSLQAL